MMRTDIHRESALKPEDYSVARYIYTQPPLPCFGAGMEGWAAMEAFRKEMREVQDMLRERGEMIHGGGWSYCDHCGAHYHHGVVLEHKPTGKLITVGWQCAEERFSLGNAAYERKRIEKVFKAVRARRKRFTKLREFVAAHPEVRLLKTRRSDSFFRSLRSQLISRCELSARQLEAISQSIERAKQREQERAERDAMLPEPAPVIEGRIEMAGMVLGTKWQESDYGGALKMLFVDDRGFKVWGSAPTGLVYQDDGRVMELKGKRIKFRATVTKSPRDENFGFFKRPTNAELAQHAEV